jgi:hypothetical protein
MRRTMLQRFALTAAATMIALPLAAQELPRVSPKSTVQQTVGLTEISVVYSRPGVRGRQVFGELVPFGQVWRTGANEATVITFGDDVTIEGEKLAAGSYSLHTIPAEGEWTVIFNRKADQWGSYEYKPEDDALRVSVRSEKLSQPSELLTISFPTVATESALMVLDWADVRVPVRVGVDVAPRAIAAVEKAMAEAKADDWRPAYRGADFAFNSKIAADRAMGWLESSLKVNENYYNMTLKAKMLADKGDTKAAIAAAEKAIQLGKASERRIDTKPAEDLLAAWKAQQ